MPTDTERLDFLSNLPTAELIKQHSSSRGQHWPWKIKVACKPSNVEFDDLREAVDYAMEKNSVYINYGKSKIG